MSPHPPSIPLSVLKKPLEDLYEASKDALKRKMRFIVAESRLKEIHRAITDVQKVKTMWRIEKEVKLLTFYYPSKVVIGKNSRAINAISQISETERFVIQGTVGQGKAIFLRFLCIRELSAAQRIPVFLELRRYDPPQPFREFLINGLESYRLKCDEEVFEYFAESGKLVLLLDAFDEIEPDATTRVISHLESLAQRFPRLQIVITSRPDSGIERSPHFRVYQLAPLTPLDYKPFLERIAAQKVIEIVEAIQKAPSDVKSLLQTPLLLTLLVLIYKSTEEIPSSLSEFYDALFHTLLTKHDKTKPGFRRKRATRLSDAHLKKLFEAFCYAARQRDQLVLSERVANDLLERACKITGLDCSTENFLADITKVACLMQQEGFDYQFIHKSVAEFHAASFISRASEENAQKFYVAVLSGKWAKWGQELQFLSQMDASRYSKYFYIPSSRAAMKALQLECCPDVNIPDVVARELANRILIIPNVSKQGTESSSHLTVSGLNPTGIEGYAMQTMVMDMAHHIFHDFQKGGKHWPPTASKQLGLGDYIARCGKEGPGFECVRRAVKTAIANLQKAESDLALERQIGDLVAP